MVLKLSTSMSQAPLTAATSLSKPQTHSHHGRGPHPKKQAKTPPPTHTQTFPTPRLRDCRPLEKVDQPYTPLPEPISSGQDGMRPRHKRGKYLPQVQSQEPCQLLISREDGGNPPPRSSKRGQGPKLDWKSWGGGCEGWGALQMRAGTKIPLSHILGAWHGKSGLVCPLGPISLAPPSKSGSSMVPGGGGACALWGQGAQG